MKRFSTSSKLYNDKGIVNSILYGDRKKAAELQETYSRILAKGTSIHELVIHNVKPQAMHDYVALAREFYPLLDSNPRVDCKLFGSWNTVIGGLDQVVNIWEYSSYTGYENTQLALAHNANYASFMGRLRPMLQSRENQIILEFAFWNASVPTNKDSIYELRSYLLKPGRMLEWEQAWSKGLQARKKYVQPVGAWFSQLGQLNYVHHMWAYPSLQVRKEMREKTWEVKEWGESVRKTTGLIDTMNARILSPIYLPGNQ